MCIRQPLGMFKMKLFVRKCNKQPASHGTLMAISKTRTRTRTIFQSMVKTCSVLCLLIAQDVALSQAESWSVKSWSRLLDYQSKATDLVVHPLAKVRQPWRLCALYPHLKDSYWLSINYGMVDQARKLGISLRIFEAGGYFHEKRQANQLEKCIKDGSDAILLGTVTHSGHTARIVEIAKDIPVIGLVNNLNPQGIAAMSGVDWGEMGRAPALFLASKHQKDSEPVRVAWFPGSGKDGIASSKIEAFQKALHRSSATLTHIKYGDTGKMIQLSLLEDLLDETTNIDYIVGTGVTVEAAISELRLRGLETKINLLSGYFTHGVYRGLKRGKIDYAPTDQPVLQGRLSIDQAVRVLEGKLQHPHLGPQILSIKPDQMATNLFDSSLSPPSFRPTFRVEPSNLSTSSSRED